MGRNIATLKNVCVIGSHVFFVEQGVPHTGLVKEVYENSYHLINVTFLHSLYDDKEWEIRPEIAYKTDEIYLPQFPTQPEINKVSQIMHSYTRDKMLLDVDYAKIIKTFPKKRLMSSESGGPFKSPVVVFNQYSFVTFDNEKRLHNNDSEHPLYKFNLIPNETASTIIVVEKYLTNRNYPDEVYIPDWKDPSRKIFDNGMTEDKIVTVVENYYESKKFESFAFNHIYIDKEIDETHITSIYQLSPFTVAWYVLDESPCHYIDRKDDGLYLNYRFYEKSYIRR